MSFPMTKLAEITEKIGSGVTPRGGDAVYVQDGTSLIRSQNIYNSQFTSNGLVYVDDSTASKMKGVTVFKDDVLLNITGDSVARCCKVDERYLPARVNQHVAILRADKSKLDPDFLMFYLTSSYMQTKMLSWAGSGGTRKALTKGMIESFEVPTPNIDVQLEISGVLKNYNGLIENNKRRIELLEESARQLYKEWFVRFRFPGHEHVKIIDGVPEGWSSEPLESIVGVIKNSVDPTHLPSSTPYIGLEHMPRRSFTLSTWETAEKVASTKYEFKQGDILFGKIRPYFHKVGFTLTAGITSSDAIVMRPKQDNQYFVVLCEVASDQFIALASKTVREGSKMPRADWNVLKQKKILFPSGALLEAFNGQIMSLVEQCKTLSYQNANLTIARDILLPKLMNGEIAV